MRIALSRQSLAGSGHWSALDAIVEDRVGGSSEEISFLEEFHWKFNFTRSITKSTRSKYNNSISVIFFSLLCRLMTEEEYFNAK